MEPLESQNQSLTNQVSSLEFDLDKANKEIKKWKRIAQAFYKVHKEKESFIKNDSNYLLQISRRLNDLSKSADEIVKTHSLDEENK